MPATSAEMSSRHHGESSELTRVQSGVDPEVDLAPDRDEPLTRRDLAIRRDRVLEVPEQDVGLQRQLRHLGQHLRIGRIEEVDHARRLDRNLAHRLGGADGEGLEEISRASHPAFLTSSRVVRQFTCDGARRVHSATDGNAERELLRAVDLERPELIGDEDAEVPCVMRLLRHDLRALALRIDRTAPELGNLLRGELRRVLPLSPFGFQSVARRDAPGGRGWDGTGAPNRRCEQPKLGVSCRVRHFGALSSPFVVRSRRLRWRSTATMCIQVPAPSEIAALREVPHLWQNRQARR